MSRLDRHVAMVQNKLALGRFFNALAWASLGFVALVWLAILVDKVFQVRPPRPNVWFWSGAGLTLLVSLAYAIWRRPSSEQAAVAIDEKLGLKEKFSTALYVRPMKDPFAQAAVRDAEHTAENVSLHKRFPLSFPRATFGTATVALAAFLTFSLMRPLDLFGKIEAEKKIVAEQTKKDEARKAVKDALAKVEAMPQAVANEEAVQLAKRDLELMLTQPVRDPEATKRNAAKALQDLGEALKQQIQSNQKFAEAANDAKMFKSVMPPEDQKGPIADAQRKMAKGDFGAAMKDLEEATRKFDGMSDEEKKEAADQMKQMAQALNQMANDPKVAEQVQQQLQQMGMNAQQAQQAQQLMQEAAAGDKQAQQQLAQMAQQQMQQMNNGQGPTPQQQQQMQQMMNQMQAMQNGQMQAQQMAQAAQQMQQAMQQAQQGGQNPAQQGQQNQQMQQGMAGMQQMLQQMQAMQADAQQVAAAQAAAAQAAQAAAQGLNGGNAGQQGQGANGNFQGGNNNVGSNMGQWNGQVGRAGPNQGGQGAGDRSYKEQAPFGVKQEIDNSEDIEGGKILANTFIKAKSLKGESKAQLQEVTAAAEKEATDEVDQERISKQGEQVVKGYFETIQRDAQNPQ